MVMLLASFIQRRGGYVTFPTVFFPKIAIENTLLERRFSIDGLLVKTEEVGGRRSGGGKKIPPSPKITDEG